VLALDALLIPAGRVELGVDELGACIGFVVQEQTYAARGVSGEPPSPRAGGRGPVLGPELVHLLGHAIRTMILGIAVSEK
jgi:hypothetical protein